MAHHQISTSEETPLTVALLLAIKGADQNFRLLQTFVRFSALQDEMNFPPNLPRPVLYKTRWRPSPPLPSLPLSPPLCRPSSPYPFRACLEGAFLAQQLSLEWLVGAKNCNKRMTLKNKVGDMLDGGDKVGYTQYHYHYRPSALVIEVSYDHSNQRHQA